MSVLTRSVLTVVSVLLLAVTVTWFLAGVQGSMAVGPSCATGGPYEVIAPCPYHTTSLTLGGMFLSLLVALGGTVPALGVGAPNLVVPYWTASLGGLGLLLFLDGLDDGRVVDIVVGIGLGLVFALPGLYLMSPWQRLYDREPVPDAPMSRNAWWGVYVVVGAVGVLAGSWTAHAWL